MKMTAAGLSLLLLNCASPCRGQSGYLNFDLGAAVPQDVDLHQYISPTPGAKLRLDTGVRMGAAVGCNFNRYVGVEFETGFISNGIKDANDSWFTHVPLMVNAVLRYDTPRCRLVPYAGAGVGGDVSTLSLDYVRGPGGVVVDGTSSTFVFAWQAFAGARYRFNSRMSAGIGYKFYWADDASWDVDSIYGGSHSHIKTGAALVHSAVVNFNMKF
jgi:opacity protein-like surface antigen